MTRVLQGLYWTGNSSGGSDDARDLPRKHPHRLRNPGPLADCHAHGWLMLLHRDSDFEIPETSINTDSSPKIVAATQPF